jgi:hypothetical protein
MKHLKPWVIILVALTLCLPALATGWQFDDLSQRELLKQASLPQAMAHMFVFLEGDPARSTQQMIEGQLAWWTLPNASNMFWRPLSAFTHWLDYRIWPEHAWLMHIHNLVWFAALLAVLSKLYQRLLGSSASLSLALLIFAIDDARGYLVAWIANRNALICVVFGLLAFLAHLRWRENKQARWLIASVILMSAALLAAEAATAVLGLVFAYAIWLDTGTWRQRLISILPLSSVVIIWRLIYRALGYSAWGTSYIDPQQEPITYLSTFLWRAPLLLLGQITPLPAEFIAFVPWPWRLIFVLAGILSFGFIVWLAWRYTRTHQAAFWLTAMLFALIPPSSAIPANRLLCWISIAFAALLALIIQQLGTRKQQLMLLLYIVIPALLLPITAYSPALMGTPEPSLHTLQLKQAPNDVVIVQAPSVFTVSSLISVRRSANLTVPQSALFLAPNLRSTTISRPDQYSLVVQSEGFGLGFDPVFRAEWHQLKLGEQIELPHVQIRIEALTNDGRPQTVRFRFAEPLEAQRWQWLIWHNNQLIPFDIPQVHQQIRLAGWF